MSAKSYGDQRPIDTATMRFVKQRPWGRNKPKPTGTKFVRQTVYLDQRHVGLIHEWNPHNSLSFSERLRQILDFVQSETR